MGQQQVAVKEKLDLSVLEPDSIKNELALVAPKEKKYDQAKLDPAVIEKANKLIEQVMSCDPQNPQNAELRSQATAAIDGLGEKTQREAAALTNSPMLKQSIATLASRGEDGGDVAKTLLELNAQVLELDPSGIDFSKPGGIKRFLQGLPFIGLPLAKYFARYEKADAIIGQIVQSLINGREQLARDNTILVQDQAKMRTKTDQLEQVIGLGLYLDQQLDNKLQGEIAPEDPRHKFIGEELLFPLRQRIQDLQQQLAVNQQGVLVFELIVRNNRELIKGVKRAEMVTITALNVAVAAALALGNQKLVLATLNLVNKTTSDLIRSTAEMLKMQGAEIHTQAASGMIEIDALKSAFTDIRIALDDITAYRLKALDTMKQNITIMESLTGAAKQTIEKMEKGDRMAPIISLDVD